MDRQIVDAFNMTVTADITESQALDDDAAQLLNSGNACKKQLTETAEELEKMNTVWRVTKDVYDKNVSNLETALNEAETKYNKKFDRHREKKMIRKVYLEDDIEIKTSGDLKRVAAKIKQEKEVEIKLREEERSKSDYNPLEDERRIQGKAWRRVAKEWVDHDGDTSGLEAQSFDACSNLSTELILLNDEHAEMIRLRALVISLEKQLEGKGFDASPWEIKIN